MMRMTTNSSHTLRTSMAVFLLAGLILMSAPSALSAQEKMLVPVTPPPGAELPYNIPLQPWLVETVLELKTHYADGIGREFGLIAETRTGDDLATIVEAGEELSESARAVGDAVRAIGELDVTFGIEGISRIIPAESALRDTLFGYVVWHEFSSAPAKGMMTRFETLVGHVVDGGEASGALSEELASAQRQLRAAVEEGNAGRIAELAPIIVETSKRIDGVCLSVAGDAHDLSALVDSLGADSGELLRERWMEASRAVVSVRAPAEKTEPALEAMSDVLELVIALGEFYAAAQTSVDALSAPPDADGNLYISWTVVTDDCENARDLEKRVIVKPEEEAHGGESAEGGGEAEGVEGEHGHAHGHGEKFLGHVAGDESRVRLAALLPYQVRANAMLAERAVEYTSTVVAATADVIEDAHLAREGYSDDLSEKRKTDIFAEVDRKMRENMELYVAKTLAKAARDAIARGRRFAAAGSESDALYHYHNAWLHSLNAGAAAQRSLLEMPSH